jgi:transglutaminase-like putative cysteine protease
MNNIENYVESNIEYEFHWHPQGVYKTLRTMKGDCTDKALLKCYYARKEGLKCRTVHGYVDNKVKHDWVEYKINNSWQSNECDYYINCKKVGAGIW